MRWLLGSDRSVADGVLWAAPGIRRPGPDGTDRGDPAPEGIVADDWACDRESWAEIGCETPWESTT